MACRASGYVGCGAQLRMSATDREAFHDQFHSFRTLGVAARLGWSERQVRRDAGRIRPAGGSARIYFRAVVAHLLTYIHGPRRFLLTPLRTLLLSFAHASPFFGRCQGKGKYAQRGWHIRFEESKTISIQLLKIGLIGFEKQ